MADVLSLRRQVSRTSRQEERTITDRQITRPISEKLADLSQRAKAAEDAFAAARADTKQAVDAKLEQARASVEQLKQKLQQDMSAGAASVQAEWQDVQGRIAKRVDKIKADVAARKQE